MAIIRSTPSQRLDLRKLGIPFWYRRNSELLALFVVALILGFSIAGAYRESKHKPTEFADVKGLLAREELFLLGPGLDLNRLAPIFDEFGNQADRRLAVQALSDFLLANPKGVSNVGALSRVRIPGSQILAEKGSLYYARALNSRVAALKASNKQADPSTLSVSLFPSLTELKPSFIVRTPEQYNREFALWVGAFAFAFLVLHFFWRFRHFEGDPYLLPLMALISGLGLSLMINLRDPLRDTLSFASFSGGPIGGCLILLLMSSSRLREIMRKPMRRWTFVWLACALFLSTALILFGTGPGESDAKVNLLGFQPIEVIKIFVVLFLASYFAKKWVLLRELHETSLGLPGPLRRLVPRFKDLLPLAVGMALVLLFLFFQRDLGPALVFTGVFLALFSVALGRFWVAFLGAGLLSAAIWAAYYFQTPTTVYNRVLIWIDPWNNQSRGAEQMAQSLWAFASGGLWGRGFGMGEPALIPAGHTDFVLAGLAEDIGFVGMTFLFAAYVLLFWRSLRVTMSAGDDYDFFLGLGLTVLVAFQVLFIACGVLSLVPLSGVVVPFISFGRTSMWVHFAIFGFLLLFLGAEARVPPEQTPHRRYFHKGVAKLNTVLSLVAVLVLGRLFQVMVIQADELAVRPARVLQADKQMRDLYNPRLQRLLREFDKGDILDRHGLPLATSDPALLARFKPTFDQLEIDLELACPSDDWRWYPFGNRTFHLLGDARTQANWTASNSNYIERDYQLELRGFTTWQPAKDVAAGSLQAGDADPETRTARIDFSPIVPLLRHGPKSKHPDVEKVRQKIQDIHLTIDGRLQYTLGQRLDLYMRDAQRRDPKIGGGSVVVVDAESGELLASLSWPMPQLTGSNKNLANSYLDRARKGLYPPGSTFKVLGAIQALRQGGPGFSARFPCVSVGGGRVGFSGIRNGRQVTLRDDGHYRIPHGNLGLDDALVISCNAYFSQMTETLDPAGLLELGNRFNIRLVGGNFDPSAPVSADQIAELGNGKLLQTGIGQGQVLASPLRMSMVAAAVANEGKLAPLHYLHSTHFAQDPKAVPQLKEPGETHAILDPESAERLGDAMRRVVSDPRGTAKRLQDALFPVAGKTGTAQNPHGGTHAWFIGFTPHGPTEGRRLAFCIMIENAGGGGSAAAPFAGTIIAEAHRLGVFSDTPPPEAPNGP